jgi:hypothetical protein
VPLQSWTHRRTNEIDKGNKINRLSKLHEGRIVAQTVKQQPPKCPESKRFLRAPGEKGCFFERSLPPIQYPQRRMQNQKLT